MAIEGGGTITESFEMDFAAEKFDEALVKEDGWVGYANKKY
jgi:hypothetical protein